METEQPSYTIYLSTHEIYTKKSIFVVFLGDPRYGKGVTFGALFEMARAHCLVAIVLVKVYKRGSAIER